MKPDLIRMSFTREEIEALCADIEAVTMNAKARLEEFVNECAHLARRIAGNEAWLAAAKRALEANDD